MNKHQLSLLIRYINKKVEHACHQVKHSSASYRDVDELVDILKDLEESCEEPLSDAEREVHRTMHAGERVP